MPGHPQKRRFSLQLKATVVLVCACLSLAAFSLWMSHQEGVDWRWQLCLLLAVSLVLCVLCSFLFRAMFKPLSELSQQVRELDVASAQDIAIQSRDECGQLAEALNDVLARLRVVSAEFRAQEEATRQARDLAIQANKTKSRFLANMSHELRTPLNAIIGYSELLIEELGEFDGVLGADVAMRDLPKITAAGTHLLSLINNLLDLSKIEAGKMELSFKSFVLPEEIQRVMLVAEPLFEENGNEVSVDIDARLYFMESDPTRFRQILLNVLSNAAKFTHDGRIQLRVSAARVDGSSGVCLSVEDSGVGMSEEQVEKILLPFIQAEHSTTSAFGGTGLGLAICHELCKLMGGHIAVESQLREGTTVSIWLPLSPTKESASKRFSTFTPLSMRLGR